MELYIVSLGYTERSRWRALIGSGYKINFSCLSRGFWANFTNKPFFSSKKGWGDLRLWYKIKVL